MAWLARRLLAAAQDRGVARFQAQRRGVRRDVGPRFVNDADHAQRHAHPADLDAAISSAFAAAISPRFAAIAAAAASNTVFLARVVERAISREAARASRPSSAMYAPVSMRCPAPV
jgi:hypothetical protein